MQMPTRREILQARLDHKKAEMRIAWLRLTGRCPGCLQRKGQHKFGCSRRPGKGAVLYMVRKEDL